MNKDNLNNATEKFNLIIYDCFHDNYGTAKKGFEKENELLLKYKDYSKSQLKKELKRLKHNNTDTDVVTKRFVAKLLRSKVNSCFKHKLLQGQDEFNRPRQGNQEKLLRVCKRIHQEAQPNPAKLQQRNLHILLLQNIKDNETLKKLRNSRVDSKV